MIIYPYHQADHPLMWPEGWREQLLAGSPMLERLNGRLSIVSQVRAQQPVLRPFLLHPADLIGGLCNAAAHMSYPCRPPRGTYEHTPPRITLSLYTLYIIYT